MMTDFTDGQKELIAQTVRDYAPAAFEEREPLRYEPLKPIDFETNSYTVGVDLVGVVRDTVARINAAEEAIREQTIVEYLRLHGYTVTKDGS
jgi:hypothetical protein